MRTYATPQAVVTHRNKALGFVSGLTFTVYISMTIASFSGNSTNLGVL